MLSKFNHKDPRIRTGPVFFGNSFFIFLPKQFLFGIPEELTDLPTVIYFGIIKTDKDFPKRKSA